MRLALAVVLLLSVSCRSQPVRTLDPEKLREVEAVMKKEVDDGKVVGGMVMAALDGRVVFTATYGLMDREAKKAVREDTIWRIYSMSKGITSAAALILHEEGKLDLDAPVSTYVPEVKGIKVHAAGELRAPKRPPTVKDLLLHTSGYRYGGGPAPVAKAYREKAPMGAKDLDDMARRLADVPLAFDPGTDWVYGLSIDVVGLVVQRTSGIRFDRFLKERIFDPLGMTDTGFTVPPEKLGRFAANYRREKGGLKLVDPPAESKYAKPKTFFGGGGGLVGTAGDYMRFLLMVEGGGAVDGVRILKPESVKLMTTNLLPDEAFPIYFGDQIRHKTGFTLGFSVRTADSDWDPQARVGEYGWGGAASTHYWVSPKDRMIVVTMEQTMPYTFDTEWKVKGLLYDAIMN